MADLSDVENCLDSTITQIVYPNGTANPSIANTPCKIYRGWPIPANLDKDLAAGTINISVYPNDNEQKTTRYPKEWKTLPALTPALTLTASGDTITVGGITSSPLNAAAIVNGTGYVYAVQPYDTPTSIASGLAALVNADTMATSSGPVVSIPGAYSLVARVGVVGGILRETKRQRRSFQITFWCPNPTVRDLIVAPVDEALADIDFLSLPDGSAGRLIYERSKVSDRVEREGLYRRDLFYSVEYATTDTQAAYQIIDVLLNLTDFSGNQLPAHSPSLELESGGYLLMEDGSRLNIEIAPTVTHQSALLLESGYYLLTEDGFRLLIEEVSSPYGTEDEATQYVAEDGITNYQTETL